MVAVSNILYWFYFPFISHIFNAFCSQIVNSTAIDFLFWLLYPGLVDTIQRFLRVLSVEQSTTSEQSVFRFVHYSTKFSRREQSSGIWHPEQLRHEAVPVWSVLVRFCANQLDFVELVYRPEHVFSFIAVNLIEGGECLCERAKSDRDTSKHRPFRTLRRLEINLYNILNVKEKTNENRKRI